MAWRQRIGHGSGSIHAELGGALHRQQEITFSDIYTFQDHYDWGVVTSMGVGGFALRLDWIPRSQLVMLGVELEMIGFGGVF